MKVRFGRQFEKQFAKLPARAQGRFGERLEVWLNDPFDSRLRNHPLRGAWVGYRSIDVTGDYRAVYRMASDQTGEFVAIGTHSQLYR